MARSSAGPTRPHVLLITIDQWRADHCGALGCPLPITPNVDRLAREGIAFASHHANCAPCGPSRASLLTGRYLMNHRSVANGTPLDATIGTLPRWLRGAGYDPTLFGYTDTTVDPRTVPPDDPRLLSYESVMEGFSVGVNVPESAAAWLDWLAGHGLRFDSVWEAMGVADDPAPSGAHRSAPAPFPAHLSPAAHLTDELLSFIDGRHEPWAAHVTYLAPHPPFVATAPFAGLIDPASVAGPHRADTPEAEGAAHPLLAAFMHIDGVRPPSGDAALAELRATYAGMVAETDAQVGRILAALDASGQARDTLIIVTSDHGEQLGDHWLMQKLGWFPESYHVPLIIRWPAGIVRPGRVVNHFTENIDIVPTICEAIGVEVPPETDGAPLGDFLADREPARWRSAAHWEWDFRDSEMHLAGEVMGLRMDECTVAARRDSRGLYVHFSAGPGGAELLPPLYYDLETDPHCLRDRSDDLALAPRVLRSAQGMLTWRLSHPWSPLVNTLSTPRGVFRREDPPRWRHAPGTPDPG